jgi:hypothetical protein
MELLFGFQVITAVIVKMTVFLDVTPFSLGRIGRRFRGAYCPKLFSYILSVTNILVAEPVGSTHLMPKSAFDHNPEPGSFHFLSLKLSFIIATVMLSFHCQGNPDGCFSSDFISKISCSFLVLVYVDALFGVRNQSEIKTAEQRKLC